jgi:hypothetical protein
MWLTTRSRLTSAGPTAELPPSGRSLLGKLNQDSASRRGVKEGNTLALSADTRSLVDETNSGFTTVGEGAVEIVDGKTDVVDPRSSLIEELSDW